LRTLHIIPIIHTAADLGNLAPAAEDARIATLGMTQFEAFRIGVREFWKQLGEAIRYWNIDFASLLLYQDSLPVTGSPAAEIEHNIVKDLAERGSQNHLILRSLIERGAGLIGTESPELLLKEYELAKERLHAPIDLPEEADVHVANDDDANDDDVGRDVLANTMDILHQRDHFIAERIDQTLTIDQVGVLFIGLMHRVEPNLSGDIEVSYPFGQPKTAVSG